MVTKKAFASLGLAGLLVVPFALAACSSISSYDDVCEDAGEACSQTDAEIAECKSATAKAETLTSAIGCRSQFDAFTSCIVDNYETPTAAQCTTDDGPGETALNACETQYEDYLSCVTTACTADPAKCAQ